MGSSAIVFAIIAVAVFLLGLWLGLRHGRAEAQLEAEVREAALTKRYEDMKSDLNSVFGSLAAEALRANNQSFLDLAKVQLGAKTDDAEKTLEAKERAIKNLLDPLKEQIKDFRSKVEEAQKESLVGRTELAGELKQLKNLNDKLSTEAHSLSTALRQDTQKQGHWGERILLQILENSGLQRGEHYTYQESHSIIGEQGEERKQQTDVIVKLPEGRHLIVDSKVTLNAYSEYVDAVSDKERDDALRRLLRSFRDHYAGLAARNYQRIAGLKSPDFVVLFAPIEPAFLLAIREDESLWTDAYQKGVLLAGPTTILFVVRIVENLWRQEKHSKNVMKIVERGEKLYDKFVGFVDDLEAVGSSISVADKCYKEALSKLTSGRENLVRQVEMLRELGLNPKKKLKSKLLEDAGVDEPALALAAEADESGTDFLK